MEVGRSSANLQPIEGVTQQDPSPAIRQIRVGLIAPQLGVFVLNPWLFSQEVGSDRLWINECRWALGGSREVGGGADSLHKN